jgi:transposase
LAIRGRYASAGRPEKAKILDEFVALTGFHRKHAMRLTIRTGLRCGRAVLRAWRDRLDGEVGRIEIVLPGDPDQREQGIAPGIGQGRAHPMGSYRLRGRTDWPVRRHPLARGVHQRGRQSDQTAKLARDAIRARGAHLLFLPPYSPDLNPIEQVFAKLKHLTRAAEPRDVEATWRKVGELLNLFSNKECANYLKNSGYVSV